jgi:YVTN family beta-propeller protein
MAKPGVIALLAGLVILAGSLGLSPDTAAAAERAGEPGSDVSQGARRLRQPVALVCTADGKTLFVANRKSGSVSVIDTAARRLFAEYTLGQGLADLVMLPDGRHLLGVDQGGHELLLLSYKDRSIQVVARLKVAPDPIKAVVTPDGSVCTIASRWSRRLTFVSLAKRASNDAYPEFSNTESLGLPFCPCEMAILGDGSKLVVAEAFGGRVAVVDIKRRSIESVRVLPAHNIRGLAVSRDGQTLVAAHQALSRLAQTTFDDVHWGLVVRNHLRVLRTEALLRPGTDGALLRGSRLFDLGDVGYAAGDPAALAIDAHGNLMIALAGVDEIAITSSPEQAPRRTVVGRRPTALLPGPNGSVLYVANSLDDTISLVDIKNGQILATLSLGQRPNLTPTERGERLFYTAKLSHDGWMSCHSCHTDGHTNNLVSDTLGDGSFGAPKRVPSLLGVAQTGPWTWTGSIARLEDQVRKSIISTMHGPEPSQEQIADLTAYLASLTPPPPLTGVVASDSNAVARGRKVFDARKCATCHVPADYTSPRNYDVGLVDEVGNRQFNPPSLRGVSQRDAFLHDGRARSLDDVFRKIRHPRELVLSPEEIADLQAFLGTL